MAQRYPQVDPHLAGADGDGQSRSLLAVERHETAKVEGRQQVAVDDQQILVEVAQHPDRAGGAEWARLAQPLHLQAGDRTAGGEVGLDQMAQVADRDHGPLEAVPAQLAQQDLDDGDFADGDERLGEGQREGGQALATSAGQEDRPHASAHTP
jgi:hypothetical protein